MVMINFPPWMLQPQIQSNNFLIIPLLKLSKLSSWKFSQFGTNPGQEMNTPWVNFFASVLFEKRGVTQPYIKFTSPSWNWFTWFVWELSRNCSLKVLLKNRKYWNLSNTRQFFLSFYCSFFPFLSFPFLSFPFLSFPFLSFPSFLFFSFLFFSFLFFSFLSSTFWIDQSKLRTKSVLSFLFFLSLFWKLALF